MRVVLTGCSGGGKSTLLSALAARGYACVEEPGRRVVRGEMASGGTALPWVDGAAFARRCLALAIEDAAAAGEGLVFFDRSAVDAAIWLEGRGYPVEAALPAYDRAVLFPPWPELRVEDAERRGGMDEAVAEYHALAAGYPARGVPVEVIPKLPVPERVLWLERALGL